VLFFTGFERDAWIWERGSKARQIKAPKAVITVPRRTAGSKAAMFSIWQSNELKMHLFDAETERFEPLDWEAAQAASP
jgi:hypothetical protein